MPITSGYPEDAETNPAPETPSTGAENENESASALLPKSVLGSDELSPGDTITVKVVAVYEDEVEVEKVGNPDESEEEPEDDMSEVNAGLDSLAMENA